MCAQQLQMNVCLLIRSYKVLTKTTFDCYLDGYKKSVDMLEEMGRDEVNKYEIYTKFTCKELLET
jgi:hypothetical protein